MISRFTQLWPRHDSMASVSHSAPFRQGMTIETSGRSAINAKRHVKFGRGTRVLRVPTKKGTSRAEDDPLCARMASQSDDMRRWPQQMKVLDLQPARTREK